MVCVNDSTTDPYWNLAAEEYLLTNFTEPVFRLWRNDKAVIVGRYQNTIAEINRDFVEKRQIAVVRRMTGGGAVFHDLGNVNFTFIDKAVKEEESNAMFRRFTAPVIEALRSLGADAKLEGRNDLLIDGKKFSGNAMCIRCGRVLQHGTMLFSSSFDDLSGALNTRGEKFAGKAVQSNRSRVTNISEHIDKEMNVIDFIDYVHDFIGSDYIPYVFTANEKAAISSLADEKYRTDRWNFGNSPHYSLSRSARFPAGWIELYIDVRDGIVNEIEVRGDYFFKAPTEEFCAAMKGVLHTSKEIAARLQTLPVGEYFCGIPAEGLAALFF